jgi:WD40 repeat protein
MSLSLSGHINYLDLSTGQVRSQIMGHTKSISTMTQQSNASGETFYTSSYDGKVCEWDASAGCKSTAFVHTNMPVSMSVAGPGTSLHSVGLDDTFKMASLPLKGSDTQVKSVKLDAQPKGSSYCKATDTSVVAYESKVELMKDGNVTCKMDLTNGDGSSCAISPNGQQVAVGFRSGKILTYDVKSGGSSLEATAKALERHRGEVTVMVYSNNDGSMLASGDSNREVLVWEAATAEVKKSRMVYHNSKITCLSWSPDNSKVCSGSVDSNIIVWPLDLPTSKRTNLPLAHQEGVKGVSFIADNKIASIGTDACCKIWTLQQ